MTDKQTVFSPVESLEDSLTSTYLTVEEVKSGDKVTIVKDPDRPIIWTESVDFAKEGKEAKPTTIYQCMVEYKGRKVEMRMNGLSRKTIFNKVGEDTKSLAGKVGILAVVDKGAFSHFFIAAFE